MGICLSQNFQKQMLKDTEIITTEDIQSTKFLSLINQSYSKSFFITEKENSMFETNPRLKDTKSNSNLTTETSQIKHYRNKPIYQKIITRNKQTYISLKS